MPLQTETFTLEEVTADLEDEREELADEIAQIHPDERTEENNDYLQLAERSSDIERTLGGLEWVREEFGTDAEFELSGLNTQETLEIADRVDDLRAETITPTKSTNNMATIFWAAKGTKSAPFIDDDASFEERCATVRALPRQVSDFLESRISDLSTVGNRNATSFEALVAEKTEEYHPTSS
ncbi:hypothetical protein [Natronorubrum halophilum]|uniref:hypothetical protein n=1 Tax=Natronorubrum halophilum TaxID=1702106 RepID=UPI0010C16AA7|nr:hypothetical protein [Natronorubrum halophilum]